MGCLRTSDIPPISNNRFFKLNNTKKMKKIEYMAPEMEIVKIANNIALLAGSDPANEDGEVNPTPGNPTDEDWGDDY